jgi:hypothetical protein
VDNCAAALQAVGQLLDLQKQVPGQVTHSFDSLQVAVANKLAGFEVELESWNEKFRREIDVQITNAATKILANVEVKSGAGSGAGAIGSQLNIDQLKKDALIARDAANEIQNIWQFTRQSFGPTATAEIEAAMRDVRDSLRKKIAAETGLAIAVRGAMRL